MRERTLVVRGRHFQTQELVDVVVEGERILAVRPAEGHADLGDATCHVLPGLVDLQVNGYGGHDLNGLRVSAEEVVALAERLLETGTTRFCPTVTTAPPDAIVRSLRAIDQACEESSFADTTILGVHLEGPYLSPEDGPRGAHPRQFVRPPDWDEFRRFQEASNGRIRLLTLAPELPGAPSFIERVALSGVVVAIGHTAANASQIADAVAAGARLSTHLGNGSHAVLPRHPNYIWEQLAEDRLAASFIVDGFHLPPSVVKAFVRAKGVDRTILVSDAMAAAGLPPGTYRFMGNQVELGEEGVVRLSGTPYLAGSALSLWRALRNVATFAGVSLAEATHMATRNPARLLSVEDRCGQLRPGDPGDVILLSGEGEELRLLATVLRGWVRWQA